MLLNGVALREKVQYFGLARLALQLHHVAAALHVQDFVSLQIEHVLALLEGRLERAALLDALAEVPLDLVDELLSEADAVHLAVEAGAVGLEGVHAVAVVGDNLGELEGVVAGLLGGKLGDLGHFV